MTTRQLNHFLARINEDLRTKLTIPSGARGAFEVLFGDKSTPRPRYLGRANNKAAADELLLRVPPSNFKLDGEEDTNPAVTQESLEAFQEKISLINHNPQKKSGKSKPSQAKKVETRNLKKKHWRQSIKRVQKYLGLRHPKDTCKNTVQIGVENSNHLAQDSITSKIAPETHPLNLVDPQAQDKATQDQSVVFICFDVEAWEHNLNIITEIGFASLDTRDISNIDPGEGGANWVKLIRPRHFRIIENESYKNGDFVSGCADRFEFG